MGNILLTNNELGIIIPLNQYRYVNKQKVYQSRIASQLTMARGASVHRPYKCNDVCDLLLGKNGSSWLTVLHGDSSVGNSKTTSCEGLLDGINITLMNVFIDWLNSV